MRAVLALSFLTAWMWGQSVEELSGTGLEPSGDVTAPRILELDLAAAIRMAVRNNLALRSSLVDAEIRRVAVTEALARFDPTFFASLRGGQSESLFAANFPLDPSDPLSPTVTSIISNESDNLRAETGLRGVLESGLSYDLTFNSNFRSDKDTNGLRPIYTSGASLSLTQPILRQAWRHYQGAAVERTRLSAQRQTQDHRRIVNDKLGEVQRAYFDLVFARESLELERQSLALAEQQLERTIVLVETGSLARTEITVARSNQAQRRAELITGEARLETAEDRLRRQILPFEKESDWDVRLIPTTSVPREFVEPKGLTEILRLAELTEPSLLAARLAVEEQQVLVSERVSERLPRLDLTGSMNLTGLQGDLYESWEGVYSSDGALDWSLGLAFEVPLGNRAAASREHQARLALERSRIQFQDRRQEIAFLVRSHLRDLTVAKRSAVARREARVLAAEQLENERLRLSLGESTNFQVFQTADALRQRQIDEIRAYLDHRLSLLELARVTSLPLGALSEESTGK